MLVRLHAAQATRCRHNYSILRRAKFNRPDLLSTGHTGEGEAPVVHGWGLYKMHTTLLIGVRSFAVAMTVAKDATAWCRQVRGSCAQGGEALIQDAAGCGEYRQAAGPAKAR